jgi:cAMP phosphodiesterase
VLPAEHTVPAVGFAVAGPGRGARGSSPATPAPTRRCGSRLHALSVSHLVIETAFSDDEQHLARISSHLCPTSLAKELSRLEGEVTVHITHIKPGEVEAVMSQIAALPMRHACQALVTGQVFDL